MSDTTEKDPPSHKIKFTIPELYALQKWLSAYLTVKMQMNYSVMSTVSQQHGMAALVQLANDGFKYSNLMGRFIREAELRDYTICTLTLNTELYQLLRSAVFIDGYEKMNQYEGWEEAISLMPTIRAAFEVAEYEGFSFPQTNRGVKKFAQ